MTMTMTMPLLTRAQEHKLALRARGFADASALEQLILANRRLVYYFARPLRRYAQSWDDLVQEGNLGLVIAARRFDPDLGSRFATYARFWIRSCMLAHLFRTRGAVRFGTARSEQRIFLTLGQACRKLETDAGAFDREALVHGGRGPSVVALADNRPSPEEQMGILEIQRVRHRQLVRAIATLRPRERFIIRARYLAPTQITLRALGHRMGITRERVRQLESRATIKLRQRMAQMRAS